MSEYLSYGSINFVDHRAEAIKRSSVLVSKYEKDVFKQRFFESVKLAIKGRMIESLVQIISDSFSVLGEFETKGLLYQFIEENKKVVTEQKILRGILGLEFLLEDQSLDYFVEFLDLVLTRFDESDPALVSQEGDIIFQCKKNFEFFLKKFPNSLKEKKQIFEEIGMKVASIDVRKVENMAYFRCNLCAEILLFLADIIYYIDKPSLDLILSFLKSFELEDQIVSTYGNGGLHFRSSHVCFGTNRKNNGLVVMIRKEALRGFPSNFDGYSDCYLTPKGERVFEKVWEKLDSLSITEKMQLISSEWWQKNGYNGPAYNPLSKQIKENYINPAIYGTEPSMRSVVNKRKLKKEGEVQLIS